MLARIQDELARLDFKVSALNKTGPEVTRATETKPYVDVLKAAEKTVMAALVAPSVTRGERKLLRDEVIELWRLQANFKDFSGASVTEDPVTGYITITNLRTHSMFRGVPWETVYVGRNLTAADRERLSSVSRFLGKISFQESFEDRKNGKGKIVYLKPEPKDVEDIKECVLAVRKSLNEFRQGLGTAIGEEAVGMKELLEGLEPPSTFHDRFGRTIWVYLPD